MIFYFSGTGNTRWVARQLGEALGERLLYIPDEMKGNCQYRVEPGECIGFCFPTHGWQPPHIVREFIRRLTVSPSEGHFCWALTTCGDNMGEAMTILNRELAERGLQAVTQFSVIMPESYVCLPFMYTDTEERVAQKLSTARHQLPHIIEVLKAHQGGIVELERGATPRLYSYVIGQYFNRRMISDAKFLVDDDKCIQCGKCSEVCPVDNISGTPPQWLHNGQCTCCLACYHYCPVHAINYGERTRKRGQYYLKDQQM